MRRRALAAGVLVLLSSCSTTGDLPVFEVVRASSIVGELPEPRGEAVLEVLDRSGDVVHQLDLAILESMTTVRATVLEPFVEQELEFTGVAMPELLRTLGLAQESAIRLVALDDYALTVEPALFDHAMLATRVGEALIPVSAGGPIRVVFADSEAGRNSDHWIWSLRTVGPA